MKYYWLLFEIFEICLSDLSHLDAIALQKLIKDKNWGCIEITKNQKISCQKAITWTEILLNNTKGSKKSLQN